MPDEVRPIEVNKPKVTRHSEVNQEEPHPDPKFGPTWGLGHTATGVSKEGRFDIRSVLTEGQGCPSSELTKTETGAKADQFSREVRY